jgi:hypothetical protein
MDADVVVVLLRDGGSKIKSKAQHGSSSGDGGGVPKVECWRWMSS